MQRLLDVCCGIGGASEGYRRAGFEVEGVDIEAQPDYPFSFHQAEGLEFLSKHHEEYDAFHVSPPCQGYIWCTRKGREDKWERLVRPFRELLLTTGKPWVIECNGKARHEMLFYVTLCGLMFGLPILRHRHFETPFLVLVPQHPKHEGSVGAGDYITVAGHGGDNGHGRCGLQAYQEAMKINWGSSREQIAQCIPPAYTEFIGKQLRSQIR